MSCENKDQQKSLLFQKQNLAEPDKLSADQPKGLSLLQRLRQSEKEKQQNTSKWTPYLGDLANWKVSGKAKQGSKNDSEVECQSKDQKDDAPSTFKEALDSFGKIKNDSEISFKMNNTNVPELCNMITSFQTEIINSNVANNEVVEFKCLLDKLNALCNKNKNTRNSVHSVHSEDKFDSRKIGTPSFKSSINKWFMYNGGGMPRRELGDSNCSADFFKAEAAKEAEQKPDQE